MWKFGDAYKGFTSLYPRSTFMLTSFFVYVDFMKRHTNLWSHKPGQFFVTGSGASLGFIIMWPFEVVKNLAQADFSAAGTTNTSRFKYVYQT